MRTAILTSNPSTDSGTFGVLMLDDHSHWSTGELPWRDNKSGQSCIPAGTYTAKWFNSPAHGMCYMITGVQGRAEIEIHSANFAGDKAKGLLCQLLGCIALGKSIGMLAVDGNAPQIAVLASKEAIAEFDANLKGEDFTLTITRN